MATEQLKKIIGDVHARRIVLPQFQRDFVWQPSAVVKLLASLFNGYPIGSLLLMENNDNYEFRTIDGVPEGQDIPTTETLLVLDGQQRLTACYRAFVGSLTAAKYAGRYYFDYGEYVRRTQAGDEVDSSMIEDLFTFVKAGKARKDLATTADELSKGLFLSILFLASLVEATTQIGSAGLISTCQGVTRRSINDLHVRPPDFSRNTSRR